MTTSETTPAKKSVALNGVGWILRALLLVYAAVLHRGVGPIPGNCWVPPARCQA